MGQLEKVNGTTSCVLAAKVMVKYTRREIRSLSDQDRETFFQAAMIMQRVPTEIGQRLFGSAYKSKDYFNRVHLYYGGTADCDHWHQGAGFVTSHMAFSLEFEKALQSIYPSTSVPYWDFTMESTFYEPATWRQSPIFAGIGMARRPDPPFGLVGRTSDSWRWRGSTTAPAVWNHPAFTGAWAGHVAWSSPCSRRPQ